MAFLLSGIFYKSYLKIPEAAYNLYEQEMIKRNLPLQQRDFFRLGLTKGEKKISISYNNFYYINYLFYLANFQDFLLKISNLIIEKKFIHIKINIKGCIETGNFNTAF